MQILEVSASYQKSFNKLATHPLQSWEWGEFRQKTGVRVVRLGKFNNGALSEVLQMTIHQLPGGFTIGYVPKSHIPSQALFQELYKVAKSNSCIFIKFEPNVIENPKQIHLLGELKLIQSPHPLFTKYTFQLDLEQSEETLLKNMHPKTRYNIKVAQKNGVVVKEETSTRAFQAYLDLTFATSKRQGFFAHNRDYHGKMWDTLRPSGIAHLLCAEYEALGQSKILTAWILFLFHNILYYPYGASSSEYRNVMASNLMMWEAIHFGKKQGAKLFDLWGSLGPNPDSSDPWYGFHRFKLGYSPKLITFVGSFDAIVNPYAYRVYTSIYFLREKLLTLKRVLTP
ncbi:peptidoglycan bridge formation glycyltransferase FemA/FemB family protein [Candidatus Gottesmanbacteria bacterium]|nr:peptidoglycan bridge formation glycyltransferase FemA/FemB family protein [Candidatus Gottesmanbacteria bacterium]